MLQGMDIDPNPMLAEKDLYPEFDILYEDQHLLAINKPPDFLSVPGKQDLESIYSLVKRKYPNATGPLMVHRLDMSTSGILLIAKAQKCIKTFSNSLSPVRYPKGILLYLMAP